METRRPETSPTAYEAPATLAGAAALAGRRYGERPAVRWRAGGEWRERSFAAVAELVSELARGLIALGVGPGERVAILAETRPEWTYASQAVAAAGAVTVPLYPSGSAEEWEWVLGNSGASLIFCAGEAELAKLTPLVPALPELRQLVSFEPAPGAIGLARLAELGEGVGAAALAGRAAAVAPGDPYMIVYTSGTTGPAKGVVLSHRNWAAVLAIALDLGFVGGEDVVLLHLPLAHVFAMTAQVVAFEFGGTIAYFGGDVREIAADLVAVRPTYFPSVPRLFEKIYALLTTQLREAEGIEGEELELLVELGLRVRAERRRRGRPVAAADAAEFERAERLLYANVRALFGGRVRDAVTGAAPLAPEIVAFFHACGVPLLEGWGMTETTGLGCVSSRRAVRIGAVGRPVRGLELRLAEDGEVLVRGPNVFREYWRDPGATAAAFTAEGWLRTGDLGSLDEDGFLTITGRKKEIIVTAGGENVAPANIESDLRRSPWLTEAVLIGDRRPYLVALLAPDWGAVATWAEREGLEPDPVQLAAEPRLRALLAADVERVNGRFARHEQVKRFAILTGELSQEGGELTSTLKVRRAALAERHAELIESLYTGSAAASGPAPGLNVRR